MRFEDAMNEVLETSRYDFLTGRRVDIGELILEHIENILEWIFENLGINLPQGNLDGEVGIIAAIFTVVMVVLIVVGAYVLVRAFLRSRVPKQHTLEDIFEEMRMHTVSDLLEMSRSAENTRIAVRYKYIAAILHLNENDIITIEPSATNAVILRQLRDTNFSAPFSQIADAFHLTWFGHKDLSDENFQKFDLAVGAVVKTDE